uniref:Orotate phosphoribosyltransferase n=1 Tax=uncultured Thiotrichaceae bacterium TaxID=298394 RepID=A0A6S6U0T2_9GAMM|nr:MAG: Orotate phosphoribosyltransferase [uncultured Thiotrichaceae bacterium]
MKKLPGLMVRAKRKTYGTASIIDGRINRDESVIVVDDSICSGNNMLDCIDKLEQAGLHVEGCVCLVRFGYDSGYAQLTERGYRVLALFDQGFDISPQMPNDHYCPDDPVKESFRHITRDEQTLPDYLSPFQAIRRSINHFWDSGRLLKPPAIFNQPLETRGGLWLSLRAQNSVYTSQGRHGFWQFPQDETISSPLTISYASWLLAHQLKDDPHRQQCLDNSALGLSLFSPLESCSPGEIDPCQHGLVVRSQEAPWKMGGALPNMPGFHSTVQLLWHARFHNTQLWRYEPYHLYRHSVRKLVEPGAEWPKGGKSVTEQQWDENPVIIQQIATQLLEWAQQVQCGETLPESVENLFIPAQCQWLFLSVYARGTQIACMGNIPQDMTDLLTLVKSTAQDERWRAVQTKDIPVYIRVAILSQSQYLGYAADLQTLNKVSLGHDAVAIQQEQQFALILPEVAANYYWTAQQLNDALYQKAAIPQQIILSCIRFINRTAYSIPLICCGGLRVLIHHQQIGRPATN